MKTTTSSEPNVLTKPVVTKKWTKRAASSPSAPPQTPPTLRKEADTPSRPKKRAKTYASPSLVMPSTVATPAQEIIVEATTVQITELDHGSESILPPFS
ncbi:hypothetical protein AMTR_s00043p00158630 [Amborella trichopoda]|uniref:Uncharacterized protein n=1 Tax=Amborella trichopoda TaxID=13333 RepID=W1PXX4_AMBTC|nr:hypothetical protein AMTR_s00043p00158630 [Amborella trichopoda]